MDDPTIWPVMSTMVECMSSEFAASADAPTDDNPHPPPEFIGVLPGQAVVLDYVGPGQSCAMAWVRLVNAFPSTTMPEPDASLTSCKAPFAYTLEIATMRCAPQIKEVRGKVILPTLEEQFEATRLQMADMRVMRRAVRCCLGSTDYVLSNYTPLSDEGGVVGGGFTLVVSEEF